MVSVKITPRQDEYLRALGDGQKNSKELAQLLVTTMPAVTKMMAKLRGKGLVRSEKTSVHGGAFQHELVAPYQELRRTRIIVNGSGKVMAARNKAAPITEEEILYFAILRNNKMTGQSLCEQFHRLYPHRPNSTILNTIRKKARDKKLCR